MKLNSTIEKKLLKYSAMAGGVVAMGTTANAQITYYDENPDVVITGHQQGVSFDFDNDANDDMTIATLDASQPYTYTYGTAVYPGTVAYKAVPVVPGSGAGFLSVSTGYPDALNLNDPINSAGAFATAQGSAAYAVTFILPGLGTFPQSGGPWLGVTDKYLGVRFTSAGNLHYGWVRMDVDGSAATVTIKDWAFNTTPDQAINAGQTTVGVAEQAGELALVRFFNNRLDVNVVNGTAGNVSVVNMEGKVVFNKGINSSFESIDLSNLSAGLYVVNAEFAEGSVQHKIVVR